MLLAEGLRQTQRLAAQWYSAVAKRFSVTGSAASYRNGDDRAPRSCHRDLHVDEPEVLREDDSGDSMSTAEAAGRTAEDTGREAKEPASVGRSDVDEARNRSFGAGLVDDPYPTYHRLLRECPVHAGGIAQHFGVTSATEATGDHLYTVNSFRECVDILKSDTAFTNQWYEPSLNVMIGPNMLGMDEPQHKRFRLLVQRAFSKREMRWWRSDIVEPIV